jgi:glycosyltransferase involved in cell wall biosynthesis
MRRLRSLYLCYLSLDDPLVHTQVIAYLRGLAADGHCIHLLTFETGRLTRARRRALRERLSVQGINWHRLRYHRWPSLPATVYDTLAGALYAALIGRCYRLDTLHARSHVPAAIALIAQRLLRPSRMALIFDVRGLMAEEYVDAGRWRRGGLPFQLTKAVERVAVQRADGIVVLTERTRGQLFAEGPEPRIHVIPCCADVDALAAASSQRDAVRAELALDAAKVMVYVGKFGGWYMATEMAQFFAVARHAIPDLHFLILTQSDAGEIRQELDRQHAAGDVTITSVAPEQLGRYLAAADFGICFIRPTPSKASSSPTKVGEYLAAGLPVVSTAGVGDLDTLITPEIGVLVTEHTVSSYRGTAAQVSRLVSAAKTRERCRETALRELSLSSVGIPRYESLYSDVAERIAERARRSRDRDSAVRANSAG